MPAMNKKNLPGRLPRVSKRKALEDESDTTSPKNIKNLAKRAYPTASDDSPILLGPYHKPYAPVSKSKVKTKASQMTPTAKDLDSAQIDQWGWSKVDIPDGALLTGADDVGGFMMLEELNGIDIVPDETDDRMLVFKKIETKSKKHSPAVVDHETPLSEKEMESLGFIHVDSILPEDNAEDLKRLERRDYKASQVMAHTSDGSDSDSSAVESEIRDLGSAEDCSDSSSVECALLPDNQPIFGQNNRISKTKPSSNLKIADKPTVNDNEGVDFSLQTDPTTVSEADSNTAASEDVSSDPIPAPAVQVPSDFGNMDAWVKAAPSLNPWILKGLFDQKFTAPTPIQAQVLPIAIQKMQNVVGAAETGSGKTLAFGLPILNHIANRTLVQNHPIGLVLSPTRELALQIARHLKAIIKPFSYSHPLNRINIVTLVGGFSEDKQRRLLTQGAHIVVATPGRIWDMIESGQLSSTLLDPIRFVVLDEADRMLESGKFKELENIIAIMTRTESTTEWHESSLNLLSTPSVTKSKACGRQMFVFSATLPILTPSHSFRGKEITLTQLLSKLNLKQYASVDVTGGNRMTSNLIESKIDCTPEDKELYLYYLLSRYPGRTLVFVNAISTIRRLVPILQLLRMKVLPLHAQMQQRQRVKNLEHFTASENGILIASDIASRGLDIKNIDHVIHFQVPLTSDLYVHRSGRTARGAESTGLSIVMVSPKELPAYHKICKRLGKTKLPEFPLELQFMNAFRKRFKVAHKLETFTHTSKKKAHNQSWETKVAEALDIELSDGEEDSDIELHRKSVEHSQLQAQLNELLDQIILPKGTKTRYLTSDVANALNSSTNKTMPVTRSKALDDFSQLKKKMRKVRIAALNTSSQE